MNTESSHSSALEVTQAIDMSQVLAEGRDTTVTTPEQSPENTQITPSMTIVYRRLSYPFLCQIMKLEENAEPVPESVREQYKKFVDLAEEARKAEIKASVA